MSIQNKSKLYLFDLDGTLINTSNLIINSLITTIKYYSNAQINIEDLRGLYKDSPYIIIKKHAGNMNIAGKMKTYWKNYDDAISTDVKTFPEIIEMLRTLKNEKYGLGIVTSLPRIRAKKLIDSYLKITFDVFIAYRDTVEHKPNPEPIYLAIEKYKKKYQIKNVSAIYIGDSKKDLLAGKNASIYTGLAAWGLNKKEILIIQKFKPNYIFNRPLDLLSIEI